MLEILFLLLNEYFVNFPKLILDHMNLCLTSNRAYPLPYTNLLPAVFAYFKINLKNEPFEKLTSSVGFETINRLGMFLNPKMEWVFFSKLSQTDLNNLHLNQKKSVSSSGPIPEPLAHSSFLEERMRDLELGNEAMREDLKWLANQALDCMASNREMTNVVNAKVNQMFLLNSLTFACANATIPLSEDEVTDVRKRVGKVMLEVEKKARSEPVPFSTSENFFHIHTSIVQAEPMNEEEKAIEKTNSRCSLGEC